MFEDHFTLEAPPFSRFTEPVGELNADDADNMSLGTL